MATALFYQPQCGIAGDMHLAALIDLGVPLRLRGSRTGPTWPWQRIFATAQ